MADTLNISRRNAARAAGGTLALVMAAFAPPVAAQPTEVLITQVFVDVPTDDQVTIVGRNFDLGPGLSVTLGELGGLVIDSDTATDIVAQLPVGLAAGDYRLEVITGNGGNRQDTYDLTIAATVPAVIGVPTSGIILWNLNGTCPANFERLAVFDGRFLVGSATPNTQGGANDHTHGAGSFTAPAHSHTMVPFTGGQQIDDNSGGTDFNITTSTAGGGTATGTSGSTDSRPAFRTVLLCRRT